MASKIKPFREVTKEGKYVLNLAEHRGQSAVWRSKARFIVMSAGCVGGETIIDGTGKRIDELAKVGMGIRVLSLTADGIKEVEASSPFLKGREALYRVVTESGREIIATLSHKMLFLRNGLGVWLSISQILNEEKDNRYVAFYERYDKRPLETNRGCDRSVLIEDGQHLKKRVLNSLGGYSGDFCLYGGRPQLAGENGQEVSPLQAYVLGHNYQRRMDVADDKLEYNHLYRSSGLLATQYLTHPSNFEADGGYQVSPFSVVQSPHHDQEQKLSEQLNIFDLTIPSFSQFLQDKTSSSPVPPKYLLYDKWDKIVNIEYVRTDEYYDMTVPIHGNYIANGLIHHNTQGGKTCIEPDWLRREIEEKGEGDYLVVTATFPLLELKLLPEFLTVFEEIFRLGEYKDAKKIFYYTRVLPGGKDKVIDKTRIIFASATHPESVESASVKAAVLDEVGQAQFQRGTHEAVERRLSLSEGRILYGTTLYNSGWFIDEVYTRAERREPGYELVQFNSIENPAFSRAEYERAREKLPSWKFAMFYQGKYMRPAGLVYDSFDANACKIKRFPIPKHWLVFVGHDFGLANPAAMFYAQDPSTGIFYAFHEYLPKMQITAVHDHVENFKSVTEGYNVVSRVGGNWTTEEETRQAYTAHGWHIQKPRIKSPVEQINKVYAMHKLNKIKVFDDLHNYLDQKLSFSYQLDDKYEPIDKYENEAKYHLLAAERYLLSDFTPDTVENTRKTLEIIHCW